MKIRGRSHFLVVALVLAGIVGAVWTSLRMIGGFRSKSDGQVPPLRDVYADSPYRNARPGVGYVGDAVCVRCHREIAKAYRSHPMGRSLAPIGGSKDGPPTGTATGLPLEAQGLRYTIERRDGRVFHKATRRDAAGDVLSEIEAEVQYALGSGRRGINFLIERDGFVFLSPIAWFAQQGRWDVSPGFEEHTSRRTSSARSIRIVCFATPTRSAR